jgi:hypothetical protein
VRKIQSLFFFSEIECELHVQGFKEGCDYVEDICLARCGIVESGSVDQNDAMSIQVKSASNFHRPRENLWPSAANTGTGSVNEIDELSKS